jgi:diguanylate cyclase (GGDEF)-like protein
MKSIRFGLAVIAICGIAAVVAAIQAVMWDRQVGALRDAQEAINAQILELRNVMNAVVDTETGQRGYLLTGDDDYLQPYRNGRRNFGIALGRLNEMLRADPATLSKIAELENIAGAKEAELARTLQLRESGDGDGALAMIKTGEGRRLMVAFREGATALVLQLRAARTALGAEETRIFHLATMLGGILLILITILVGVAIRWLSVTLRRVEELQLRREEEAMHDALTALPNRRYLYEWLTMQLAAARRGGQRIVLLYFDLDGFKAVNDRLGHEAGDRVLQTVAARVRATVRSSDFVARLGGDEFVAVLPDAPAEPELSMLIARLGAYLAKAPITELADGDVSASMGISRYPEDGDTLDALLKVADQAMYTAKQHRRPGLAPVAAIAGAPAVAR